MKASKPTIEERLLIALNRITSQNQRTAPGAADLSQRIWLDWVSRLRPGTVSNVESDLRLWADWCTAHSREHAMLDAATISSYAQSLDSRGLHHSTIASKVGSIELLLKALDWPDPDARTIIIEVRRTYRLRDRRLLTRPLKAPVFGWSRIQKVLAVGDPQDPTDAKILAILLVLYDTLARRAQVFGVRRSGKWYTPPLRPDAVQIRADGTGHIRLSGSRGNPDEICTLSPLTISWIQRHRAHSPSRDYLFASRGDSPCTSDAWVSAIEGLLRRARQSAKGFGTYSILLGAASDLLRVNTPLEDVCRAGRWANPAALLRLISVPSESFLPTRRLGSWQAGAVTEIGGLPNLRSGRTAKSSRSLVFGQRHIKNVMRESAEVRTGDLFAQY